MPKSFSILSSLVIVFGWHKYIASKFITVVFTRVGPVADY